MSNKKVSIITPTYNIIKNGRKNFFYECFRSIHEQDYDNIEHVIIDGHSNDGSVDFIKKIISRYKKKEIIFISEEDTGINDATNKGFKNSSGDYIILMNDDDYYTQENAISLLVKTIESDNYDFACADCWWLNTKVWKADIKSFACKHPFLINTFLLKREILDNQIYLDTHFAMVADFDLFIRILSNEKIKGAECHEVLTVLRPGGFSSSSAREHIKETAEIYKKYFGTIFSSKELINLHYNKASLVTLLKICLFIKNKKIIDSVFYFYDRRSVSYTHLTLPTTPYV